MLVRILVFLGVFCVSFGYSQENSNSDKPKIGLVLSGGGAKGFAHIGVLKVIEKSGIKLDYIGGTSMGAVVGALYASGYSAHQIDSIIKSIDFPSFLQDQLPRKQSSLFRKQHGERTLISFPVRNKKIGLPKAISVGQSIYNRLNTLLEPVINETDFSKLPIPFFCVATDLENGNSKVFDSGFLPAAIRASASLPTLLDPFEYEGHSYIDGGIADNFPVEVMRKKGVSIVIGVDVQGKLEKNENVNSVLDVLNQIVNYQMYARDEEKIHQLTLRIKPDLKDFSVTSFKNVAEIIDAGEISAKEHLGSIDSIASLQKNIKTFQNKPLIVQHEKYTIADIELNTLPNYSRAYVLGKLKLEEGDELTYNELDFKLGGLSSSNDFGLIQYKFEKTANEKTNLHFQLKENPISTFVKLGVHFDPLYKSAFLFNVTSKHILQKNDILSFDFIAGDNVRSELNYFVDNGFYTSYGISNRFNQLKTNVKFDGVLVNSIDKSCLDLTSFAYIQTTYNKKFAIGTGVEYKYLELATDALSEEETYFDKSSYLNSLAFIKLDTYDRNFFPKEGVFVDGEFKWYMASSDYFDNFSQFSQLKLKLAGAKTFFDKLTMHLITEGGTTIGNNSAGQFQYSLGGVGENMINNHIPFYGYDFESLQNNSYLKSSLEFRFEFVKNHMISFTGNYARTDLDIYNGGKIFKDIKSGYAVGYGFTTVLGPLHILRAWSPDSNQGNWYLNFGFWF